MEALKELKLEDVENEIRSLIDEHIIDSSVKEKFVKSAVKRVVKRYYGWEFDKNLSPDKAICIVLFPQENKMKAMIIYNSHPCRPDDPKGYNFEIRLFLNKREGVGTGYDWYNFSYYKIIQC